MTDTPSIYEETLKVPSYFVDEDARMTVSSLFGLLTEISNRHASCLNAGWHQLRKRGFFWVITRMRMEINRLPEWTETVTLRTWVRESQAATSPRDYEMLDADGNVLIAASSVWAILDIATGHPQRMSAFDADFPMQERCAIERKPQKINAVTTQGTDSTPLWVHASDIDMNRHVNNAHYIQWAFDSLTEEFRMKHRIATVTVNFISQAKLGDQYRIRSEADGDNSFRTSIISANEPKEYCRLQTEWRTI